jgi:RNA polymerase sigma-70 factor (ECF subfamily)
MLPPLPELYARHGRAVLRRIRQFYPADEAEEVLQEVFERLITVGHTFRGESLVTTWLYALTTRHCLTRLRNHRRRLALLDAEGVPEWADPATPPDAEATALARSLWRRLDEEVALIGIYYHVDGMSQAEIGALLGLSGRTISSRLRVLQDAAASEET